MPGPENTQIYLLRSSTLTILLVATLVSGGQLVLLLIGLADGQPLGGLLGALMVQLSMLLVIYTILRQGRQQATIEPPRPTPRALAAREHLDAEAEAEAEAEDTVAPVSFETERQPSDEVAVG